MDDFNNRPLEGENNENRNGTSGSQNNTDPSNIYNGYNNIPPQQPQQPYPPSYYSGQQYGQQPPPPPPPPRPDEPYRWDFESMKQTASTTPPKKKQKGAKVFGIIAAAIALTVVGSFACYGIYVAATGDTLEGIFVPAPGGAPAAPGVPVPEFSINDKPAGTPLAADAGLSNSDIFKKVSPTVVGIVSYVQGNPYIGGGTQEQGSGIIMSEDGYIITNAHVVANASEIEVVLADGKTYDGTVIGMDIPTDLAVVKIEATGLIPAEFGNSEQMEVGERVVAIGNPGGLQFASSLTVGYVSALNRSLSSGEAGYELECIQTDAAINPGNSGGALINAYGQVVGINSAKIKASGFEGMGFAIPINDAMPIIEDIIKNGKVTGRAMLGIQVQPVSPTEAQYSGSPMGLRIMKFDAGTDMERKGAQVGDIITHINNTPVYSTTGSAGVLKEFKPGDTVTVSLYRINNRGRATTFNIDIVLAGS
ncbi:MAG: trypsin-like peptidase domain-containing protein [Angelakisella sp.]